MEGFGLEGLGPKGLRQAALIPGLRVSPGEIALDGALVISVFDGYLHATGLRLREPYGRPLCQDSAGQELPVAEFLGASGWRHSTPQQWKLFISYYCAK